MRLIDISEYESGSIYCAVQVTRKDGNNMAVDMIETIKIKTVDAVEVVRCKDCRKRRENGTCNVIDMTVADDGFCDLGEKRRPRYDFDEEDGEAPEPYVQEAVEEAFQNLLENYGGGN